MLITRETLFADILQNTKNREGDETAAHVHLASLEFAQRTNNTLGWAIDTFGKIVSCGAQHAFNRTLYAQCPLHEANLLCKHPQLARESLLSRLKLAGALKILDTPKNVEDVSEVTAMFGEALATWRIYFLPKKENCYMISGSADEVDRMLDMYTNHVFLQTSLAKTELEQLKTIIENAFFWLSRFDQCCHIAAEIDDMEGVEMIKEIESKFIFVFEYVKTRLQTQFSSLIGQNLE